MTEKYVFLILFWLLQNLGLFGQYYDSGQERFGRWSLVETDHFKVLFPSARRNTGLRYAGLLEQNYLTGGKTLGYQPRKIPVVLHPQTAVANGMVNWAPRRSNLFLVAPPDNFYQPWEQHLVLHEFRHVVQVDRLHRGFTRVLGWFTGEQAEGAVLGLHLPMWFLEGDAVAYETGASFAGRGRVENFCMELNTQVAVKGIYSYPKAMFGSYADYVPDHYQLGYQLVSFGRLHYGPELWEQCLDRVARKPYTLRPFGRAVRDATGLKEPDFYKTCLDSLKVELTNRVDPMQTGQFVHMKEKNEYTSYFSPYQVGQDGFIAYREQLSDIPAFIYFDNKTKKEELLARPGYLAVREFSFVYPWIVWNQYRFTRWDQSNYSQIICFNIKTHQRRTIDRYDRVYSSQLSPDKRWIASTEFGDDMKWSIVVRDFTSGKPVESFKFDTIQPTFLSWSPDGSEIGFITIGNQGKSVGLYHRSSKTVEYLIRDQKMDFSGLQMGKCYLVIRGNYNEKPAWFRYWIDTQQWELVAYSKYGVGEGSLCKDTLVYSDYSADGFRIAYTKLDFQPKFNVTAPTTMETPLTEVLSRQEKRIDFSNVDTNFQVHHFNRFTHLFNFHSWAPMAIKLDDNDFGPGLTFMSQDVLSTSFFTTGYQYYYAENRDNYFVDYKYKGFYPTLGFRFDYDDYWFYKYDRQEIKRKVNVDQQTYSGYLQIPVVLHNGSFNSGLSIESGYEFIKYKHSGENIRNFDTTYHSLYYSLYGYMLRRQSHRDLQPKLGFAALLGYMHHPVEGFANYQFSAQGWLYLPGLKRNHGMLLYGGYQEESGTDNLFSTQILYPKGCSAVANTRLISFQASYKLPLWYPDACIGPVLYIKRIKANAFYGYTQYYNEGATGWLSSAGCDLTADFHVFRFLIPFEMGGRYARRFATNDNYFGIILKMDIGSLY